eukprot:m.691565 g.691565  ORF g.691565 m.691565 type:complete len:332 (-) comp22855_c0_seq21:1491-2486(-)
MAEVAELIDNAVGIDLSKVQDILQQFSAEVGVLESKVIRHDDNGRAHKGQRVDISENASKVTQGVEEVVTKRKRLVSSLEAQDASLCELDLPILVEELRTLKELQTSRDYIACMARISSLDAEIGSAEQGSQQQAIAFKELHRITRVLASSSLSALRKLSSKRLLHWQRELQASSAQEFRATLQQMSYLYTATGGVPSREQYAAIDTALEHLMAVDMSLGNGERAEAAETIPASGYFPLPVQLLLEPLVVRFRVLHGKNSDDGDVAVGEYERMSASVFKWFEGHATILTRYARGVKVPWILYWTEFLHPLSRRDPRGFDTDRSVSNIQMTA